MTTRILFVCLGNICRSPTAEGVFTALAEQAGVAVDIDSAGTGGWHVGDPPDARARAEAARRGYDISGLRARQARAEDFERFDLILAMDRANHAALERMRPAGNETPVRLFLDYANSPRDEVPDPYYEGGFDLVLDLIEQASRGLLEQIAR
ncbi:low molecular weight protein-tyrosine-phosphatase [Rhodovulum adriaticum]|uniref:protein-tyrosine-phosphatase n=1 Tax=Rhodovulum adriaticum TaxID=35804 RepID=A0A4R2NLR3_RHOAD|nr:low molecular weight protein-tyrosine-phosphatase [Rhodovulum adriaticum]MBK1635175.1 phosphotyrosine protein phosphatase [Rhodovulum adriaticum]TCP22288.1 protein-tyrosine phosphatase [Rhodovulum adriaticum]